MLTALELENFKGVAARQRIDFAPLTLLFGANSAGKSTILQALLYLHELLERGSADVDRTQLGGTVIELGGFSRLVHRHELDRAVVLRAEFATPGSLLVFSSRDSSDFPFPDLDDDVKSAWVEFTIVFSDGRSVRGPIVEQVVIGVGGIPEPLVSLHAVADPLLTRGEGVSVQAYVNDDHPLVVAAEVNVFDEWGPLAVLAKPSRPRREIGLTDQQPQETVAAVSQEEDDFGVDLVFDLVGIGPSALPALGKNMQVRRRGLEDWIRFDEDPGLARATAEVETFLEMVVLGTLSQLARSLRDALYIGPLRTMPSRGFLYERTTQVGSWADGLAAWEGLLAGRQDALVRDTNDWLRRLDAGCQVVVQQLFDPAADAEELSVDHVDKTVRRLLLDTGARSFVLPSEVGAGVAQVVPIVVAALTGKGMCLIEQPEIHVHPAMQARLGDLFIEGLRDRKGRPMVVETHSEHLILRLLRRIRETAEATHQDAAPAFTADKLSVIYVESTPEGVRIRRLRVGADGAFIDRWPKGFFAERMEEML